LEGFLHSEEELFLFEEEWFPSEEARFCLWKDLFREGIISVCGRIN
jgi:hypothetical protein